jgi:hypothetical protein
MSPTDRAVTERRVWQGAALPKYQTASGAIVTIDAPGHDLSMPWYSSFRLRTERPYQYGPAGPRNRAFQVAPVGTMANHAHYVVRGKFTEELTLAGGFFLVVRSDADGRGLTGWQGRWHEVYTFQNTPGWTTADALRQFQGLTFQDTPLGVRVRPADVPPETMYAEEVTKPVPAVGFLTIVAGGEGASLLPNWAGARTRSGGEVWRKHVASDGTGRVVLLHASPTAVTAVYAEPGEKDIEEPRLRFLDALTNISWSY